MAALLVAARYAGATMALYSCVGGFLGDVLFGAALDAELRAWVVSFATCGLAFLTGTAAMLFLSRHFEPAPAA